MLRKTCEILTHQGFVVNFHLTQQAFPHKPFFLSGDDFREISPEPFNILVVQESGLREGLLGENFFQRDHLFSREENS